MVTFSEENYLKSIYQLGKRGSIAVEIVSAIDIVAAKPSSVADMVKKLADKDLVNYVKYQGVSLTEKGKFTAANVLRRHRLWETFLVEKLDFPWDEVHEVAEQLEHINSEKLTNKLDELLGHPTHDPHGDPIPDKDGNVQRRQKILLSQVNQDVICTCSGVIDSSSKFLKYLDQKHIALGTQFQVISKEDFDDSITIQINSSEITISKEVANNIYVKIN